MVGFMVATSSLSMWISNTATSAMMIPILEVVLLELKECSETFSSDYELDQEEEEHRRRNMRAMLAMAICFSANVGGTATLIGTGANVVLTEYLKDLPGNPISFGTWMLFALPQTILCLIASWVWLYLYFMGIPCFLWKSRGEKVQEREKNRRNTAAVAHAIKAKFDELGPVTFHEMVVVFIFAVAIMLWFFISPGFMTGWGDRLATTNRQGNEVIVSDATPAILMTIMLFVLPAKPLIFNVCRKNQPVETSPQIISWHAVQHKVPWGIILLVGGGYALAEASDQSCLSAWIASQLLSLKDLPVWIISLIASVLANLITQVASNAAAASILIPILKELALGLEINPLYLLTPATLCCSYAFMLPISTGPNAILFGPSGISVMKMVRLGFVINVVCLAVVTVCINTYGYYMFDLDQFPNWAQDVVDTDVSTALCDV